MSTLDTDGELERELARLAESIDAPHVPVSSDVARGRRRLVRTRLTVAGAAAVTAAVLGSTTLLGPGASQSGPAPTERTPDAERTTGAERTAQAPPATRALPPVEERAPYADVLTAWNDALAARLDPQREHLAPYSPGTANQQTAGGPDGLVTLGSRFGWSNPGEEGLGMLEVSVSDGTDDLQGPCDTGVVPCRQVRGPGGEPALVGATGSLITVEVEQPDGETVVLTLDLLFGNNSVVPVSGADVTPEQLLRAAADPALDLPEPAPRSALEAAELQRVAEQQLLAPGETLLAYIGAGEARVEGSVDRGRRQVAVLRVDAYPTEAGYGLPTGCDRRQFLRCERVEVDGQEVWVGETDEKYFPGLQVVHAGPTNVVRVQWERAGDDGAAPDLDALAAFVTDPRWQS